MKGYRFPKHMWVPELPFDEAAMWERNDMDAELVKFQVYVPAESIEALLSSHPTDGQPRSLADALRELLEGK